jgi:hypothetical protein
MLITTLTRVAVSATFITQRLDELYDLVPVPWTMVIMALVSFRRPLARTGATASATVGSNSDRRRPARPRRARGVLHSWGRPRPALRAAASIGQLDRRREQLHTAPVVGRSLVRPETSPLNADRFAASDVRRSPRNVAQRAADRRQPRPEQVWCAVVGVATWPLLRCWRNGTRAGRRLAHGVAISEPATAFPRWSGPRPSVHPTPSRHLLSALEDRITGPRSPPNR